MDAEQAMEAIDNSRKGVEGENGLGLAGLFIQVEQQIALPPTDAILAHALILSAHARAIENALRDPEHAVVRENIRDHIGTLTDAINLIDASMVLFRKVIQQ